MRQHYFDKGGFVFQFHKKTGEVYLADPRDAEAVKLLHDYVHENPNGNTLAVPFIGAVIVWLLCAAFLTIMTPEGDFQGIATTINLLVLGGVGFALLRMVATTSRAHQKRQLNQAVAEGRIVSLPERCWTTISKLLVTSDVNHFVPHYPTAPEDFAIIEEVAADYWRGLVDANYLAQTIRPALDKMRDRIRAAQQAEQAQRAPIVAAKTA